MSLSLYMTKFLEVAKFKKSVIISGMRNKLLDIEFVSTEIMKGLNCSVSRGWTAVGFCPAKVAPNQPSPAWWIGQDIQLIQSGKKGKSEAW